MAKSILIVNECPLLEAGLKQLLMQSTDYEISCCNNAEAALNLARKTRIDLVITSFTVPKMGALELISRLTAHARNSKVLVCANEPSLLVVEKCIQTGARGYVTINVNAEELTKAVETIMADRVYTEASISQQLALTKIRGDAYLLEVLSPREFDIFMKVIKDKPVKIVAKELFLAEKTVANYVSIIKKKLHAKTNAGLLEIAIKEGFVDYPTLS